MVQKSEIEMLFSCNSLNSTTLRPYHGPELQVIEFHCPGR